MIAGKPCVLIADDDPVTLQFLAGAVGQAGCTAVTAECAETALLLVQAPAGSIDLLLLDRRMPDRDGCALLQALRTLGIDAPAVATSAELDAGTEASLRDAGFAETLLKPASVAQVHALLHRFIEGVAITSAGTATAQSREVSLLEDASALVAVGGDRTTLRALRALFARELSEIEERGSRARTAVESAEWAERLHRLRASCGICGALQLRAAAERLAAALQSESAAAGDAMQDFLLACRATRQALAVDDEQAGARQA